MKILQNKGITLVALVVTIAVLLILAGISITALFGDNGIIARAKIAAEKTQEAEEKDKAQMQELADYLNGKTTKAGEKVEDLIKPKTTEEGEDAVIGERISDGAGGVVPVPEGFYYVGGTVKSGAVISDNIADKNKYKGQEIVGTDLSGNQFVFIPANGASLTYAQDHTYDSKHQNAYTTNLSGWTNVTDWSENSTELTSNIASVKNYGGFYIARYEAGYPDTIEAGTIVAHKDSATNKVPVSKAGVASWNLVSRTVAKDAAESMYNTQNSKVSSKLVDSYAWDTTCKWLKQSGVITETAEGKINSTSYGNYNNSTFTIKKDTLYTKHLYLYNAENGGGGDWYYNKGGRYSYSTVEEQSGMQVGVKTNETLPEDFANRDKYTAKGYIEIATGTSEATRTNNIYDLAGNMWEWTTETRIRKNNSNGNNSTFAVLRGGSFSNSGSDNPIVYRYGNETVGETSVSVGFRSVLYIK